MLDRRLIPKRYWEKREEDSPLYLPRYRRQSHQRRAVPVPMAVIGTPVALTPSSSTFATTLTQSLVLTTGDLLIVSVAWLSGSFTSLTWNSINLTQDLLQLFNLVGKHGVFSLYITSGATGDLVLTTSAFTNIVMNPARIPGGIVSTAWTDKTVGATTTTTTSPSSGATATLSQANEIAIGAFADAAATIGGSWSNSFTEIQTAGTSSIETDIGYLIVSSTSAVTAAKTGTSNNIYSAICVTYMGTASSTDPPFNPNTSIPQHWIPSIVNQ